MLVRNTVMPGPHLNKERDILSIVLPIRVHQQTALRKEMDKSFVVFYLSVYYKIEVLLEYFPEKKQVN